MSEINAPGPMPDPVALSQNLMKVSQLAQEYGTEFLRNGFMDFVPKMMDNQDTQGLQAATMGFWQSVATNPTNLMAANWQLWQDYSDIWTRTGLSMMGMQQDDVVGPEKGDRRFKADEWNDQPWFSMVKQLYLATSRAMIGAVNGTEGLEDTDRQKLDFYTRQIIDALSPSNFALTNPDVIRSIAETNGENLVKGMENFLKDTDEDGRLRISMTDMEAFEPGKNVAGTAGKVVFQNDLMQLLQYTPTTEKTFKRPLLIVPPWINKFYILDLRPENSFIKWAVEQGHTVFVISWVNPGSELAEKNFEDYMLEGPVAAVDAIEKATGEKSVNAIGYCIGGTLLAATLAYMQSKRRARRIASATFFTTMLDFCDPGEISVFIDEEQISSLEEEMSETGYLDGRSMANAFNLLRSNDLIWSFVVNNYLMGRDPRPFDLLYWNSDSTRMPAAMHSFYLRNMYKDNQLKIPGALNLGGVDIDLGKVKTPAYFLSTKEDHIAPWKTVYEGAKLLSGPRRMVLGGSGHIAGVINPPAAGKYCFWVNEETPETSDEWLDKAEQTAGSWWGDWQNWVGQYTGAQVAAREPGAGDLEAIEDAPGSYVKA